MISRLRICLATHADAGRISALSAAAIEYGLRQSWTARRIGWSIRNAATNVVVAHEVDQFAGFGIMDYDEIHAHLALLAVARESRRQGIGSALLAWLEKSAVTAGIRTVRAEVRADNAVARAFYRASGYRECKRLAGYYQGVADALGLEKRLGG